MKKVIKASTEEAVYDIKTAINDMTGLMNWIAELADEMFQEPGWEEVNKANEFMQKAYNQLCKARDKYE